MRVVFPDPILETLKILRAELPGYVETADVDCGSVQVEEATASGVSLPYLMVALDDTRTRYPVSADARLRVTVWAAEDWRALEIGGVARAILRDSANSKVRSYGEPASGPNASSDPDSGQPLSTQTVTARLKPETL